MEHLQAPARERRRRRPLTGNGPILLQPHTYAEVPVLSRRYRRALAILATELFCSPAVTQSA